MKTNTKPSTKHVPERTCLACRQVKAKKELVRLVRSPTGGLEIDTDGKKAGRGAYLCSSVKCWELGLKGNRIEHALKISLAASARDQLMKAGRELCKEQSGGEGQ